MQSNRILPQRPTKQTHASESKPPRLFWLYTTQLPYTFGWCRNVPACYQPAYNGRALLDDCLAGAEQNGDSYCEAPDRTKAACWFPLAKGGETRGSEAYWAVALVTCLDAV